MAKSGSKFITGLIAFLLGFILGILAMIGAVAGVCVYVVKADLNGIFRTLGIKNQDEEGNYLIVNTEEAKNLGELISQLKGYVQSDGSSTMDYPVLGKSIDEINDLLPVVQNLLKEKLYPAVDKYMDVDWEEFEGTAISNLPQFLSDSVMDIRPAKLLESLGMNGLVGEDANVLVKALLAGAEFDYAYNDTGARSALKFPVYYDTYTYNEKVSGYFREEAVNGQQAYPSNLDEDLLYDTTTKKTYEDGTEKTVYRLYYIPCALNDGSLGDAPLSKDGETIYAEGTTFIAVRYEAEGDKYILDLTNPARYSYPSDYGFHNMDRTGNFYFDNDGEELQIYPVTIRSFSDPDEVFKPLYSTRIKELLGKGEDGIIESLFGNLSVGELMDGKIDFDETVNNLELSKVMTIDPEQSVMAYIGYGLSRVQKVEGQEWDYVGRVEIDGVSTECYLTSELKGEPAKRTVTRVWYMGADENGNPVEKELKGNKVKEVGAIAADMQVTALLNVKADDAILSYLGYGTWGVIAQSGAGYTHVAQCEIKDEASGGKSEVDVFINTDAEGYVTEVWYESDGFKIPVRGTTVNELSDRISSLTDKLALPDVLDIKADQSVTAYVGYGVTHIAEVTGKAHSHEAKYDAGGTEVDCFITTDETGKITSVWYMDGENKKFISGTTISKLPERIDGISNDLTLSDVMDISEDDTVLWALRDSKIRNIGKDVKGLKIKDVLDKEDVEKSMILKQLANSSIDGLSDSIDALSMQIIYCKEIYVLPDDCDPFEVVPFVEGKEYFTTVKGADNKVKFVSVGTVSQSDFDNRGRTNYFVKNDDGEFCIAGFSDEWLFYVKEEGGIKLYDNENPEENDRGKLAAMPADGNKYYSYGYASGMWKLIVYRRTTATESTEKAYTLNNFATMINNCTVNIYNATLFELQSAGIIDDKLDLSKTLTWSGGSKQLSAMTFKELMEVVIGMAH